MKEQLSTIPTLSAWWRRGVLLREYWGHPKVLKFSENQRTSKLHYYIEKSNSFENTEGVFILDRMDAGNRAFGRQMLQAGAPRLEVGGKKRVKMMGASSSFILQNLG